MAISGEILNDYQGCGAYLVAYVDDGGEGIAYASIKAIKKIASPALPSRPVHEKKRGGLSKTERIARATAEADYWRGRFIALEAWADELKRFAHPEANKVEVCDLSCTEIVFRHTDLAWKAQDALNGRVFDIYDREGSARAFAREKALTANV